MLQGSTPTAQLAAGSEGESPKKKQPIKITTASITLGQIPKCHQVDALEVVCTKLDATRSGTCEQDELAVIHWMLNRLRPDMKVGDLRCGDYDQVAEKFKLATERVRESSPADFDYMVDKIVHYLQKSQFDKILDMALELGFDPEWLSRKKRPKKVKAMDRMAMSKSYKKQEEAAADQGAGSSVVLTG